MASYSTGGDALIALPNGAAVPVSTLAQNGVPGYAQAPDGSYVVPGDATFRTPTGNVPAAQSGSATAIQEHPVSIQPLAGTTNTDPSASRGSSLSPSTAAGGQASADAGTAASVLRQYGLDELLPFVDQVARGTLTWAQLQNELYDPTTAPGKIVDRLYPEIQMLHRNGLDPMSIQQIQEYRTSARQMMRAAGMPQGFYDQPSDFTQWIGTGVGLPELQDRVKLYQQATSAVPQETRDALKYLYGVDENSIAAYYMDAHRALPLLQKQADAAGTAGAAVQAGYGQLNASEAERLAAAGVTGSGAVQGFGTLARAQGLFGALPGSGEDSFTRQQQLDVVTGDANAVMALQQRAAQRAADTSGGGGFATDKNGLAGLGVAR